MHLKSLLNLNIQILKHDWPAKWRSFIPDLVSAAKTSETICENCMAILKVRHLLFNFKIKFVSSGINAASNFLNLFSSASK